MAQKMSCGRTDTKNVNDKDTECEGLTNKRGNSSRKKTAMNTCMNSTINDYSFYSVYSGKRRRFGLFSIEDSVSPFP